jgi:hypothetical protein
MGKTENDPEKKAGSNGKQDSLNRDTAAGSDGDSGTDLVETEDISEEPELLAEKKGHKGGDFKAAELTPKMISLMQKISEFGYLSMEEVGLIYSNQSYAYGVIKNLKEGRLLGEFGTTKQPRKAYFLKPRGYRLLRTYGQLRIKRRFLAQKFLPFIFNHRRACAKACLIFEGHPLIRGYLPESILWERRRQNQRKICDAEFFYQVPGQEKQVRVGLEVELTLKSEGNLVESFRALQDREDLDQVWWICGDQTIFRALAKLIPQLPWIPQRQFLGMWEEFLQMEYKLELSDPKGTVFTIDPDKPTLPGRCEPPPPPPKPDPGVRPAQAEAPRPPEPAPVKAENPLVMQLRDSWLENWKTVGGIAIALSALGLAPTVFWSPGLIESIPPKLQAPKRARPNLNEWQARRVLKIPPPNDTWGIRGMSLFSKGDSYKMSLRLGNFSRSSGCRIVGLTIHDADEQELGRWEFQDIEDMVFSRHEWSRNFAFQAPRAMKNVLLGIIGSGPEAGCQRAEIPLEFK